MANNMKKDLAILGNIIGVISTVIQCLIVSQLFYEYTGKLRCYVNTIEVVYVVGLIILILLLLLGFYGHVNTNYERSDDKFFMKQMDTFIGIINRSTYRRMLWGCRLTLGIGTVFACILLSKWFVGISLVLAIFFNISFIITAYGFVDKYKDRIDRLSVGKDKVVKVEENNKDKKNKKEDDPILQRLKSIG